MPCMQKFCFATSWQNTTFSSCMVAQVAHCLADSVRPCSLTASSPPCLPVVAPRQHKSSSIPLHHSYIKKSWNICNPVPSPQPMVRATTEIVTIKTLSILLQYFRQITTSFRAMPICNIGTAANTTGVHRQQHPIVLPHLLHVRQLQFNDW